MDIAASSARDRLPRLAPVLWGVRLARVLRYVAAKPVLVWAAGPGRGRHHRHAENRLEAGDCPILFVLGEGYDGPLLCGSSTGDRRWAETGRLSALGPVAALAADARALVVGGQPA